MCVCVVIEVEYLDSFGKGGRGRKRERMDGWMDGWMDGQRGGILVYSWLDASFL